MIYLRGTPKVAASPLTHWVPCGEFFPITILRCTLTEYLRYVPPSLTTPALTSALRQHGYWLASNEHGDAASLPSSAVKSLNLKYQMFARESEFPSDPHALLDFL